MTCAFCVSIDDERRESEREKKEKIVWFIKIDEKKNNSCQMIKADQNVRKCTVTKLNNSGYSSISSVCL